MVKTKKEVSENVKKTVKNNEWEELEINKVKKEIKWILGWFWSRRLLAWVPGIMAVMGLIANMIYPVFTWEEIKDNWFEFAILFIISFILYGITLYDEYKFKRLYSQINNWKIIIKQTKIVKFKYYNRDRLDRKGHLSDRLRNDSWFRIITSDWVNKYKSNRYPYTLWIAKVADYVINDFAGNKKTEGREWRDYLIIDKITYRLWDEITVYVDYSKKRNYFMAIWL